VKKQTNLKPIAFHRGAQTVKNKNEANFVTFRGEDGFLVLPKDKVKNWELLPETV
jgi:hypothetical protein